VHDFQSNFLQQLKVAKVLTLQKKNNNNSEMSLYFAGKVSIYFHDNFLSNIASSFLNQIFCFVTLFTKWKNVKQRSQTCNNSIDREILQEISKYIYKGGKICLHNQQREG